MPQLWRAYTLFTDGLGLNSRFATQQLASEHGTSFPCSSVSSSIKILTVSSQRDYTVYVMYVKYLEETLVIGNATISCLLEEYHLIYGWVLSLLLAPISITNIHLQYYLLTFKLLLFILIVYYNIYHKNQYYNWEFIFLKFSLPQHLLRYL